MQGVAKTALGVELGRCLVDGLAFGQLAVGRNHGHIGWQEGRRDGYGSIQQTAWIVAQVQHQSLEIGFLLVDFLDLADKVIDGAFLELAQADPGVARLDHLALDRLGLDFFTGDGDGEAAAFILSQDVQAHLGIRFATHALDSVIERQALDGSVVDLGDQVAGLETRTESGRAFDGGDDLDQPVFHGDLDADANELAGSAFLEFFVGFLVEVLGVRVQAGDHAGDGVGDQLLVADLLHVIGLDQAEDGRQLLDFFKWQRRHTPASQRLQGYGGQRTGDHAHRDPACNFDFLTHSTP